MKYKITRQSDLVLDVRGNYKLGDKFTFLLLSDLHFDHPYCDREALFKVMDQAKEKDAMFLLNGDTLCLMQARDDKRGNKSAVREEHKVSNYFDAVIKDTAEQFAPYADRILLLADGNHETAVVRHKEIDPLDHLAHRLNSDHGGDVYRAGYHGFIRFFFEHESGGRVRSLLMYHHHGKFGGIVTKGVLGVSRHGLVIPQAEVIWTGHTHTLWNVSQPVLRVSANGETKTEIVHHIKTGTWKDEFNRKGGFGVERIGTPVSIGGYWMEISVQSEGLKVDFIQAR